MSACPPYRFGVSEFTTKPWTFEQDVEAYARLDVDTIEVCEVKLDEARIADQLALVRQYGLEISSVQPVVRTLFPSLSQPQPKDIAARVERFRTTLTRLAPSMTNVPFVTNTGTPPDGNIQAVVDRA